MQFRQVGTLRFGVIGAAFQFLFVTCSSLTLYFDRRMAVLRLQACFLLLNAALTLATLTLGANYLGLGFLFGVGDLGRGRLSRAGANAVPARLPDLHREQSGCPHPPAGGDSVLSSRSAM